MTTKAQELAKKLKANGITAKQVSCRAKNGSIRCNIKDVKIDPEVVKSLGDEFEHVRYCEYSQEILSGGNTFVFVQYDWEVESATRKTPEFNALRDELSAKLDAISGNECAEIGSALFYREGCNIRLRYDKGNRHEVEPYHNLDSLAWSVFVNLANGTIKQ